MPTLSTERLIMRRWREDDRAPFAAMNADPRLMEHFPGLMTPAESDHLVDRLAAHFDEHGYGLWALEVPGRTPFAGFVGLNMTLFDAPFTPAVEVGWRLAADQWGHGYATEAAREAVRYGFDQAGLDEIVSFTVPANVRSLRVMEKLGMTRDPAGDFDHPSLAGHPRARHVLYRLRRSP